MKDRRLTVLITAIGGSGHGEQILKALRTAPDGKYFIVGADASHRCPQFEMVDLALTLPRADDPQYIDAVLAVCRRFDVAAVLPGCEPELVAISRTRKRFQETGIFVPINPAAVIDTCMDKAETAVCLSRHGFSVPRSTVIESRADASAIDFFPVVVKPVRGGGSRDCFIAQGRSELEMFSEYLQGSGSRVVVQEYVGTPESEFTVGVLHDMDGNFVNSIALRRSLNGALNTRSVVRNRTGRDDLGEWLVISSGVSHGYIDRFPEVTEPCERMARALGARGPINVQCRLVAGDVKVFEINPRFSGTTSIRAMVGYNEPDILLGHHLLGEPVQPRFEYGRGWVIRSLTETVLPEKRVPDWRQVVA